MARTAAQREASRRNLVKARAHRKRVRRSREMRNGLGGVQRMDLRGTPQSARNRAFRVRGGEVSAKISGRLDRKIHAVTGTTSIKRG
jgi:hypothetical protein